MNSQHVGRKDGKNELYINRRYGQMLRSTHYFCFDLFGFKV